MRISPRLLAVGFGQNLASFLAWGVLSLWTAKEGGSGGWQSGLLPAASGVIYILVSLKAGAISDRVGRARMARLGCALFVVFCGLAWTARSAPVIAALGALNGFAMALIWPAIQARIGDASDADSLEANVGAFSLSWSAGKTAGFLAGAGAYRALGLDALLLCGAAGLLLLPLFPSEPAGRHAGGAPLVRDDHHPPAIRAAHLRVGRWANFAGYGMGSTLVYLYPLLLVAEGRPESDYAWVLGAVFLAQTAGFWLFGRFAGWRYRLAPVASWLLAGAAVLLVIGLGAPTALAVPAALVLGLALGQAYMASVYYSLHSEENRGARAGVHEAIIGAADFGTPLVGGLAASATGGTTAPWLVATGLVALSVAMAARAVRGVPTSGSA